MAKIQITLKHENTVYESKILDLNYLEIKELYKFYENLHNVDTLKILSDERTYFFNKNIIEKSIISIKEIE